MSLPASFQNINPKALSDSEQQGALVQLGQMALSDIALADLMTQAAALIAQMLAVEYVSIWELDADKKHVSLQAGMGWNEESMALQQKLFEPNSLESFTITSQYPVIIEDLHTETKFNTSSLLLEHGIVCGVSVPMGTLGVIEVFAQQSQVFTQEDCLYLQSIATVLGLAIRSHRAERRNPPANGRSHNQQDWDRVEIKNRLGESRERERLRLAQELHDVPIQDLYGLIYQIDDLKDYIKEPDGEKVLNEFNQILNRIVNNLRTICRDLRPPSLSPFGLEVAIRDHVEKLQEQNPNVQFHLRLMSDKQVLSDSLRLNLFRIYQQAISNVVRHAEATEVHIRFVWDQGAIILEVEDNGKGFVVPKFWVELVRQDHFGLVGLAERVESVRGRLEVISAPGDGTLVRAIVPRQ